MAKKNFKKFPKKGGKGKSFDKFDKADYFKGHNSDNDVSWYKQYPQLVEASSNIIFNTPYGGNYYPLNGENVRVRRPHSVIPGAFGLGFDTFQIAQGNNTDPLNVAGRNLYTWLRHANSGSVNYESSDMIQYVYTVANLAAHIEVLRRILRLSFTFSPVNKYTYVADLMATGWTQASIDAIRVNIANYTAQLNRVIAKFNTFKIPKDMHFVTRWKWLSSSVFKDDDLDKATHYLFYPRSIAHYDWANATVEFSYLNFSSLTFSSYITMIENEIENLISFEDIGIMIGDMLKAYKAEGCMVTEPISMGEIIDPYYSAEVLTQIRNTTILKRSYTTNKYNLKQVGSSTQLVYFEDNFAGVTSTTNFVGDGVSLNIEDATEAGTGSTITVKPILSIASNTPTSDEVIVATRLMNIIKTNLLTITSSSGTTGYFPGIDHSGSEVVTLGTIVSVNDNTGTVGSFVVDDFGSSFEYYDNNNYVINATRLIREFTLCSRMSYVPYKQVLLYTANDSGNNYYELFASYAGKNLLTPDESWLINLHAGCVLSEFSIPMFKLLETNN